MSRTTGGAEHQLPTAAKRWLPLVKWLLAFSHYILVAPVGSGIAGHSARSPIPDRREPGWIGYRLSRGGDRGANNDATRNASPCNELSSDAAKHPKGACTGLGGGDWLPWRVRG
jgi:hypothetical protein